MIIDTFKTSNTSKTRKIYHATIVASIFDWPARILEVFSGARALVTRDLSSRAPV